MWVCCSLCAAKRRITSNPLNSQTLAPGTLNSHLRLALHEGSTQVQPTARGIPWLGMVVYPTHRTLKARKVRHATRTLEHRYSAYRNGQIPFKAFDASVQGWINYARWADTWGLRKHLLRRFVLNAKTDPSEG